MTVAGLARGLWSALRFGVALLRGYRAAQRVREIPLPPLVDPEPPVPGSEEPPPVITLPPPPPAPPAPPYTVEQSPAACWSRGRSGSTVQYVVIHTCEGTYAGTCAWFGMADSRCSAHYTVGRDGRVAQHVSEEDTAWHCGQWGYNCASVGIEHEGYASDPGVCPELMLDSSAYLCAVICVRYGIPVDRAHILGHVEVPHHSPPHTDPGQFWPWEVYLARVSHHHARLMAHNQE